MKLFAFELFLVFIVLKQASAKVCNDTISVIREVPETYRYTYYEAYDGHDCFMMCDCTKSRLAVNIGTRLVEKLVNETVNVCCEGYIEDDSDESDGLKCIPLCNPPCENGYCKYPNECACESGYAIDPNDALNRCVPLCLEDCSIPDCLPTCSQYDEYDTSETDMCSGTCLNGTCITPGICHCDPGFRRLSEACEPICSSCEHGTCVAPGHCKCDFGWREECGSCQPACSGCEHGRCKAPGQCECNAGYKAENGKCEPHCSNCGKGKCLAPDVCACDPGWYLNGTECQPHCNMVCEKGTCIAPNVCKYYPDYQTLPQEEYVNNDAINIIEANMEVINESKILAVTSKHTEEGNTIILGNATISAKHESINDTACSFKMAELTYHWIYVSIIIVEMLVILLLIAMMNRKHILNRLKTKKFVPQDKLSDKPNAEIAVHYVSAVTCSKLKETVDPENS